MDSGIPAAATPDSAIGKWSGKKAAFLLRDAAPELLPETAPNSTLFQPHLLNGESRT